MVVSCPFQNNFALLPCVVDNTMEHLYAYCKQFLNKQLRVIYSISFYSGIWLVNLVI